MTAHEAGVATVQVGPATLALPLAEPRTGPASLAVRPHAVRLSPALAGGLSGRIRRAVYGGDHMEYDVTLDGFDESLFVIDPAVAAPLAVGAEVGVTLLPTGLALLPGARS